MKRASTSLPIDMGDQLAEIVCELRRETGLSQWVFGEKIGLSDTAVGKYESGAAGYKNLHLAHIAQFCGYELRIEFRKMAELEVSGG